MCQALTVDDARRLARVYRPIPSSIKRVVGCRVSHSSIRVYIYRACNWHMYSDTCTTVAVTNVAEDEDDELHARASRRASQ